MSMDKDIFWRLIDAVNSEVESSDQDGILRVTKEKLLEHSPEDIAMWGGIQRYYKSLADTSGVFAVSCCLNDYMSDDGFTDFRMWLVSRGKEVYTAALESPDTLAALNIPEDTRFEVYGYISNYAYKELTGGDIYDAMKRNPLTEAQKEEIRAELAYYPHRVTPENAEASLPRLFAKHIGPGKSLDYSYWPGSPLPQELLTGLDKLKNAARLIEDMTGSRFMHGDNGVVIFPAHNSFIAVNMQQTVSYAPNQYAIDFCANLRTAGYPMTENQIRHLAQEAGQVGALLAKLDQYRCTLSIEELEAFGDYICQRQELQEEQDLSDHGGPVMGQSI